MLGGARDSPYVVTEPGVVLNAVSTCDDVIKHIVSFNGDEQAGVAHAAAVPHLHSRAEHSFVEPVRTLRLDKLVVKK